MTIMDAQESELPSWHMVHQWYVLFVIGGREETIYERLRQRNDTNLTFYLPKRKIRERRGGTWRDVNRILFPGYILMEGTLTVETYYTLKHEEGIIRLLGDDEGPTSVPSDELALLHRLGAIDKGTQDSIGYSQVIRNGDHVTVISGPLEGLQGYIKKIDWRKGRAKVVIPFMQEQRQFDLGIEIITNS